MGRFGNRARQILRPRVKRITYLQTHTFCLISYDDMISDNKHGGFSEPKEGQRFPGLTPFSEAHWHYTIDTWQDQIIRSPSATVSPRSRESSVWFKWFRWRIPFRKWFPNEQAAISLADPLPEKEKKNEWKKERGIEQLSARFSSICLSCHPSMVESGCERVLQEEVCLRVLCCVRVCV